MTLLQLGAELNSLDLDEAEEAQLSLPAREAMAVVRALHMADMDEEEGDGLAEQSEARLSVGQRSGGGSGGSQHSRRKTLLQLGAELDALQLDEAQEAQLSAPAREAMAAARALQLSDMSLDAESGDGLSEDREAWASVAQRSGGGRLRRRRRCRFAR